MNNPLLELGKDRLNLVDFIDEILDYIDSNKKKAYIIFACDARVLLLFSEASKYIYKPYLQASKILSDGRPVYWLTKSITDKTFEQLTGPGFMMKVLADDRLKRKRHMFYGGSAKTMDLLRLRCQEQNVNLVYSESPPYLEIEQLDIIGVNEKIKDFEVDFFWCGLGAPKQEYLIYQLDKNRKVVMTGVGLAFDYYAGTVTKAPAFLSSLGLEWVVRYAQQPKRIGRFIRPFFYIARLLFVNQFKRDKFS